MHKINIVVQGTIAGGKTGAVAIIAKALLGEGCNVTYDSGRGNEADHLIESVDDKPFQPLDVTITEITANEEL